MTLNREQRERLDKWAAFFAATVSAALTVAAYAYATFETKEHAVERKKDITERLDRIESKQDKLIDKINQL
jgi:uncharacterized protein Yka (UPF0111/DUF47 family)